ncbi:MAG: sterol desaturase family protein [Sphingomonadales bacterium]|nr:sterol desaturase family protein [Sphingomonadales bacterium]MDE2170445.1 sterol desaturase family protein [Sphingomonadales bacterium]
MERLALARSPIWLAMLVIMILAEMVWRIRSGRGYDARTAMATLGVALGGLPFAAINALVIGGGYSLIWRHALVHWPLHDWRTWVAGFVAVEFAYYWFHRASHRIAWLWATHSVHHSAQQMTLLSSIRLGWTNLLSAGWIIYAPLVAAGFDPRLVVALLAFDLRYQFFLHTEAVGRLGVLEWVLNTPAHHRVHHASNAAYLDCNYGGVVIIFDRLFGTHRAQRRDEPLRYGLAEEQRSNNPLWIALGGWPRLLAGMIRSGRPLRKAVSPPG